MTSRFRVGSFAILFALSVGARAEDQCTEPLGNLATPFGAGHDFARWSLMDKTAPPLTPADFLPEAFVREVEAKVGPVTLRRGLNHGELGLSIVAGPQANKVILECDMWVDPTNANNLIVEHLLLENPIPAAGGAALNLSQGSKGLPMSVFRFARNQLKRFAKAGGFKGMKAPGAQNFMVLMLYHKLVGMQAETPLVQETLDYLKYLYSYAQKQLPEAYRPKSGDDFARLLGDYGVPHGSSAARRAWALYKANKAAPTGMTLFKDGEKIVGFLFEAGGREAEILFIDPVTQAPFSFQGLVTSRRLDLVAPVN